MHLLIIIIACQGNPCRCRSALWYFYLARTHKMVRIVGRLCESMFVGTNGSCHRIWQKVMVWQTPAVAPWIYRSMLIGEVTESSRWFSSSKFCSLVSRTNNSEEPGACLCIASRNLSPDPNYPHEGSQ
uniref:Secreted protein n=1 Tax=Rhipicephalus appendiculatus TaxID=34631 RepID=A0A131YAE9_RHIAP